MTAGIRNISVESTLSTANNTESDDEFTVGNAYTGYNAAGSRATMFFNAYKRKSVSLVSKTTYYLNIRQINDDNTALIYVNRGGQGQSTIRATCAYL